MHLLLYWNRAYKIRRQQYFIFGKVSLSIEESNSKQARRGKAHFRSVYPTHPFHERQVRRSLRRDLGKMGNFVTKKENIPWSSSAWGDKIPRRASVQDAPSRPRSPNAGSLVTFSGSPQKRTAPRLRLPGFLLQKVWTKPFLCTVSWDSPRAVRPCGPKYIPPFVSKTLLPLPGKVWFSAVSSSRSLNGRGCWSHPLDPLRGRLLSLPSTLVGESQGHTLVLTSEMGQSWPETEAGAHLEMQQTQRPSSSSRCQDTDIPQIATRRSYVPWVTSLAFSKEGQNLLKLERKKKNLLQHTLMNFYDFYYHFLSWLVITPRWIVTLKSFAVTFKSVT